LLENYFRIASKNSWMSFLRVRVDVESKNLFEGCEMREHENI
jgi:hypothetical protein